MLKLYLMFLNPGFFEWTFIDSIFSHSLVIGRCGRKLILEADKSVMSLLMVSIPSSSRLLSCRRWQSGMSIFTSSPSLSFSFCLSLLPLSLSLSLFILPLSVSFYLFAASLFNEIQDSESLIGMSKRVLTSPKYRNIKYIQYIQ